MKTSELKKLAKDINSLEIVEVINVKLSKEDLEKEVIDAIDLLEDDEIEDLTEESQELIKSLSTEPADVTEDTKTDSPEDTKTDSPEDTTTEVTDGELAEVIDEMDDIESLKSIVKENDIFKDLRKGIQLQKNVEKLKTRMFVCINAGNLEKSKTKKGKDEPKKGKTEKVKTEKVKTEKVKTEKVKTEGTSNKLKVYKAWKGGETDIEKLNKVVGGELNPSTIKNWLSKWGRGTGLPAGA